jgi:hypothetical protein
MCLETILYELRYKHEVHLCFKNCFYFLAPEILLHFLLQLQYNISVLAKSTNV